MKEIITMHGWCGESSHWITWMEYFKKHKWVWHNNERGYGSTRPISQEWSKELHKSCMNKRIIICHSLGLHLVKDEVLQEATHIILLNSFSRFIPLRENNRSINTALQGMKKAIGTLREKEMIRKFWEKASKPYPLRISTSGLLKEGPSRSGRIKLQNDLDLLIKTNGLPNSFPNNSLVLSIHGEEDAILLSNSQQELKTDLNTHLKIKPTHWSIPGEGHYLLLPDLMHRVKKWLETHS